jgi:hypothetical protein
LSPVSQRAATDNCHLVVRSARTHRALGYCVTALGVAISLARQQGTGAIARQVAWTSGKRLEEALSGLSIDKKPRPVRIAKQSSKHHDRSRLIAVELAL